MLAPVTDLATLGADVEWPDADAASRARSAGRTAAGRLADVLEWLAGAQGTFPTRVPARVRCVVHGGVSPVVASLAESLDVGVRELAPDAASDVGDALAAGAAVAEDEIESGTDLLVVADPGAEVEPAADAGALVVSLLTGAEPVALLPRGEAAVDTAGWVNRAVRLRDRRRAVAGAGLAPDDVISALGDPHLATTTALVLHAVARRTPLVLDGAGAVVAGLLAARVQSRATRWWRAADSSPDPVHARALADVATLPLLDLGTAAGDGMAGLLAVPLVRAAALLGNAE